MTVRKIEIGFICECFGCTKSASYIVHQRETDDIILMCDEHKEDFVLASTAEYIDTCPNCGCVTECN